MRALFLFFGAFFFLASLSLVQGGTTVPSTAASPDPWKLSLGANKPRPKNARTIIDNEEGAWFDDATNSLEFKGNVVVRDPQFKLFCDRLYVVMNPNRQGIQKIVATGKSPQKSPSQESSSKEPFSKEHLTKDQLSNDQPLKEQAQKEERVIIEQDNINDQGELIKTIARAGEVTYEPATGNMTLKQKPEIQQGMNCQVANEEQTVMILNKKGTSQTIGKSQIIVVDPNNKNPQ